MPLAKELPDVDLLYLLSQGDEWAYGQIYKQYASALVDYAESKLGSYDDAQDVVHDLFTDLWNKKSTLQVRENLKAYLFGAARYLIINRLRKHAVRLFHVQEEMKAGEQPASFESHFHARELQKAVEAHLLKLPVKTQEIFRKSRMQEKNIREIAEELHLSEQTVKNQLTIALKHLRDKLATIPFILFFLIICFSFLLRSR